MLPSYFSSFLVGGHLWTLFRSFKCPLWELCFCSRISTLLSSKTLARLRTGVVFLGCQNKSLSISYNKMSGHFFWTRLYTLLFLSLVYWSFLCYLFHNFMSVDLGRIILLLYNTSVWDQTSDVLNGEILWTGYWIIVTKNSVFQ